MTATPSVSEKRSLTTFTDYHTNQMGFSVSGSTVIILIGCLIAFSAAFTVATDGFDRITTAQDDRADRLLDRQNTAIEIGDVTRENGTTTLSVTNAGSTALSIDRTDLLIDGQYSTEAPTVRSGSDDEIKGETDLWVPGDRLEYELDTDGDRVRIVTEHGVATSSAIPEGS